MRRLFFALLIVSVFIFTENVLAATKQDVIDALNASYPVGDTTYRLPQSVINKGVNAINSKNLTSKQCDKILGMIGKAVAVAQHAGTTDITKVSKEDIEAGLSILKEASGAAKMDLGISIPKVEENDDISNSNKNGKKNKQGQVSGELISGENFIGEISGDTITSDISEDDFFDILSFFTDSSGEDAIKIQQTVERHTNIAIVVLIFIIFLNIFIIYLLFRSKWNKIAKCILVIIFVILFLSTLFVLCVGINYIEELKMIYKLYYMLK